MYLRHSSLSCRQGKSIKIIVITDGVSYYFLFAAITLQATAQLQLE